MLRIHLHCSVKRKQWRLIIIILAHLEYTFNIKDWGSTIKRKTGIRFDYKNQQNDYHVIHPFLFSNSSTNIIYNNVLLLSEIQNVFITSFLFIIFPPSTVCIIENVKWKYKKYTYMSTSIYFVENIPKN